MPTLWEVISNLAKLAPLSYAPPGDITGVAVGISDLTKQKRIRLTSAAVSLDVTIPVILKCGELNATLLISHRPPLLSSHSKITGLSHLLLQHLLKRGITVYVVHNNWASVDGGMNDVLAHALGFKVIDVFNVTMNGMNLPRGRVCSVPKESSLKTLVQHISKRLETPFLNYVGNPDNEVEKLAIVSGNGIRTDWLELAWEQGIDTYLTGSLTHELAIQASQLKIKIIAVPQVATEIPGMSRLTQILRVEHPKVNFNFIEPILPYSTFIP